MTSYMILMCAAQILTPMDKVHHIVVEAGALRSGFRPAFLLWFVTAQGWEIVDVPNGVVAGMRGCEECVRMLTFSDSVHPCNR